MYTVTRNEDGTFAVAHHGKPAMQVTAEFAEHRADDRFAVDDADVLNDMPDSTWDILCSKMRFLHHRAEAVAVIREEKRRGAFVSPLRPKGVEMRRFSYLAIAEKQANRR